MTMQLPTLAGHARTDIVDDIDTDDFAYPRLSLVTAPQKATVAAMVFFGTPESPTVIVEALFRPNQVHGLRKDIAAFNSAPALGWASLTKSLAAELIDDAEKLEAEAAALRDKARRITV